MKKNWFFYGLAVVGVVFLGLWLLPTQKVQSIKVQRVETPKGVNAWLVEDHTNPIVTLHFSFRGGAALDPVDRQGLAVMVSSLLDEGAGDLDSEAFNERLADLALSINFSAGSDTFSGRLRTLSENRTQAFRLLGLALTTPRFDEKPVERIRRQILAGLRRAEERPGSIASKALWKAAFPNHAYGRPNNGTKESVSAIIKQDLRDFIMRRLARDNLVIAAVGDVTPEQLANLLDEAFGTLPPNAAPWALPEASVAAPGPVQIIEKPLPQSTLVFAQQGIKRNDPDFYAAYVAMRVLGGGGMTSRLNDEVREKQGLAYSVYAGLYPLDHAGLVLGGAGTVNLNAGKALSIIRNVWDKTAKEGLSEEELTDAKRYLTGSFPVRFSSSAAIASMLVGMQLDDLGIDYIEKRNGYIDAVDLEQANRVLSRILDVDALHIVVVGRPEGMSEKAP
jgi:zinc protease